MSTHIAYDYSSIPAAEVTATRTAVALCIFLSFCLCLVSGPSRAAELFENTTQRKKKKHRRHSFCNPEGEVSGARGLAGRALERS